MNGRVDKEEGNSLQGEKDSQLQVCITDSHLFLPTRGNFFINMYFFDFYMYLYIGAHVYIFVHPLMCVNGGQGKNIVFASQAPSTLCFWDTVSVQPGVYRLGLTSWNRNTSYPLFSASLCWDYRSMHYHAWFFNIGSKKQIQILMLVWQALHRWNSLLTPMFIPLKEWYKVRNLRQTLWCNIWKRLR